MKLLFTLLRQFGRRMCELLFCIFCMGLFSSQSDAQTVPKKKGVLRSLSNSLPYGYTQLGNSTLYYKQNSESIDLIGQFSEFQERAGRTIQNILNLLRHNGRRILTAQQQEETGT